MIIAIDGPAAAGKGTLAKRLAAHFGLAVLDTGLLYRAVGLKTVRRGADANDADAATAVARELGAGDLEDADLRGDEAANAASVVAAIPEVRAAVLEFQRAFARNPPGNAQGAVLDGRDIGTVVCPEAEVKIFVTASLEGRARRRHKELLERGEASIYARVVQEMRARDRRDSERSAAPLRPAPDAVVLDTNELDAGDAFRAALEIVDSRRSGLTPGTRTTR